VSAQPNLVVSGLHLLSGIMLCVCVCVLMRWMDGWIDGFEWFRM